MRSFCLCYTAVVVCFYLYKFSKFSLNIVKFEIYIMFTLNEANKQKQNERYDSVIKIE